MSDAAKTTPTTPPFVTVIKGNPTPAQLAALTAVVAAKAAAAVGEHTDGARNEWGRPTDQLRPNWASATSFYKQLW